MSKIKQAIHDAATNSVEVTWEDAEGRQIKCHCYADVQMQMFRDDVMQFGGNIAEHEATIAAVEAAIVPYIPPIVPVVQQIAAINAEAQNIIYAKWPIWAQQNCNDGTYPPADKETMLADKAAVLTEAKRLTDAIIAGTPAIPAWPAI
jgi:hypothetical protein